MAPYSRSRFDDITLEHFERYCVEGEVALADPAVAMTTRRYKDALSRLLPVFVELRAQSSITTDRSFHAASQQINASTAGLSIPKSQTENSYTANWQTGEFSTSIAKHHSGAGTPFRRRILRRAAAALSIACVTVLLVVFGNDQRTTRGVITGSVHNVSNAVTYRAVYGQRTLVNLPDGSRVTLNSGSDLTVPRDFGSEHRTLSLHGEAMFTVSHENRTPFIVMAGGTTTRVLGTTFVVRHYRTDTITSVAVKDGRVAVRSVVVPAQWQANVMASGEVALVEANGGRFTFASGALTLNDMSLPDAIVELERWYDVDIRLAHPSLATHRVTGIFHAGTTADFAVVLELALDVRVEQAGRTLILYP